MTGYFGHLEQDVWVVAKKLIKSISHLADLMIKKKNSGIINIIYIQMHILSHLVEYLKCRDEGCHRETSVYMVIGRVWGQNHGFH